ncbi:Fused response regulator/phosphatase [Sulfidibacter corallicola]|uniref:Fused response regulator/phosphatase n=1 Tax=Sulfidibacter corallicola TaxID=2818388 RepID=A0A8A4TPU5_SULCO|nr:fused response regulator/phosphatase [Sulfidibacter corallicola]QTD51102.1 fused response regulator/phosphatase [Sulfidibacter corallicola]
MTAHPGAASRHGWTELRIRVLLIDDQLMVGEAVRRMLATCPDIDFHFLRDPTKAIEVATEIQPTVILQDLVMPDIDGLTLVKYMRAHPKLRTVPLIVLSTREDPQTKAEAFQLGANDYLVKLPDRVELEARIRHHSKGYINMLQRDQAYRALKKSQEALANELAHAADYIRSLLPQPMQGEITSDWRFVPSTSLGGDSFGHHWVDEDHLAMYLLDVCGHGIGPALLSISAINVLRSHTLPNVDFRRPDEVLAGLNQSFPMEQHNGLFFTAWYGVFRKSTRELVYASGGHPPAILCTGPDRNRTRVLPLRTPSPVIGGFAESTFHAEQCQVEPFGVLYLFSDGVYEVFDRDGERLPFETFAEELTRGCQVSGESSHLDHMLDFVRRFQDSKPLEDDFSLLELRF